MSRSETPCQPQFVSRLLQDASIRPMRSICAPEVETYTTARCRRSRPQPEPKIHALGCVVPHAGYMYSGHVAGAVYRRLELPRRFVILCPNHTGMGEPLAIMSEGAWHTPLGDAVYRRGAGGAVEVAHAAARPKIRKPTATSMRWKCSFLFCRCWRRDFSLCRSPWEPATSRC